MKGKVGYSCVRCKTLAGNLEMRVLVILGGGLGELCCREKTFQLHQILDLFRRHAFGFQKGQGV